MVECAGLEIRYTVIPYRGFESLLLRQQVQASDFRGLFFCTNAYGIFDSAKYLNPLAQQDSMRFSVIKKSCLFF